MNREHDLVIVGSGSAAFAVVPLSAVPRALVNRDTRGLIKIVADDVTGKVLGVHMLADGAGDVIQAAVYAIKYGLTTAGLAETWAPYLTMAEGRQQAVLLRVTATRNQVQPPVGPLARSGGLRRPAPGARGAADR